MNSQTLYYYGSKNINTVENYVLSFLPVERLVFSSLVGGLLEGEGGGEGRVMDGERGGDIGKNRPWQDSNLQSPDPKSGPYPLGHKATVIIECLLKFQSANTTLSKNFREEFSSGCA